MHSHSASKAKKEFTVAAYNPMGTPRVAHFRIPVAVVELSVWDAETGLMIPSEVMCMICACGCRVYMRPG